MGTTEHHNKIRRTIFREEVFFIATHTGYFSGTHIHTCTQVIVPVGSRFDFPEAETEQHFLERPLLAVMGA